MRPLAGLALAALLAGPGLVHPGLAGDASGFDPAAIDRCLARAETQGARADCAGTGMQSCLDYARRQYTGEDAGFPMANCLDASHQAWEAKLTSLYRAMLDRSDPQEPLRRMERSWIAFRQALCDRAGERGDETARALCLRDETARQAALLMSLAAPQ